MVENPEDLGSFWLANSKQNVVTGKLLRDEFRHPGFEVRGKLIDLSYDPVADEEAQKNALVIHGSVGQGEVSLFDNRVSTASFGYAFFVQQFRTKYVFISKEKHYSSLDELLFTGVRFELFNLDHWLNQTGFSRTYNPHPKYEFVEPDSIPFQIGKECVCRFQFKLHLDHASRFSIGDSQYCSVSIDYPDELPFREILGDVEKLIHFITFCTLEQSHSIGLRFIDVDNVVKFYQYDKLKNDPPKLRQWNYHLVSYEYVKDKLPELTKQWFADLDDIRIRPVLTLALRIIKSRPTMNILTFLDVTRALEVFHRSTLDRHKYPKAEFNTMRRTVEGKMSDAEKKIFSGLHNANNKDFRDRIVDLIQSYLESDPIVTTTTIIFEQSDDSILNSIDSIDSFAKLVSDTRNFHTHYDERYEGIVLEDEDSIRQVTRKLTTMLFWCLTKRYGFADYRKTLGMIANFSS